MWCGRFGPGSISVGDVEIAGRDRAKKQPAPRSWPRRSPGAENAIGVGGKMMSFLAVLGSVFKALPI